MNPPRLSVIIPSCRRQESLARCLDLLRPGRQTLGADHYEIIVSDDGPASDNARSLVETLYPGVTWVEGPRRGPAANRNFGASHGRGGWLIFTDDDCLPQSGWLQAFADRIDAGLEGCRVLEGRTDSSGAKVGPFETAPGNTEGGLLWSCNIAVERSLFEQMGGFDPGFPFPHLEDVDFRLRLDDAGEHYTFVPQAYVIHPPRPVGGPLHWVRGQESSFYLARKRGVPLSAVNFGAGAYARTCVHCFRASSGPRESARLVWRILQEVFLLCFYLPYFWLKYCLRRTPALAPAAARRLTGSPS